MEVVWNNDERYPGPKSYALPDFIKGVPSQEEIEAMPDMFTWGEIKELIRRGKNEGMSRPKEMEDKYETWIEDQKKEWGSAVDYLINARLPWGKGKKGDNKKGDDKKGGKKGDNKKGDDKNGDDKKAEGKKGDDKKGDDKKGDDKKGQSGENKDDKKEDESNEQDNKDEEDDDDNESDSGSEADADDSMAYISFEEIDQRQKKLGKPPLSTRRPDDEDLHPFLKWDPKKGLDTERYAILPNDWPYKVPYGVRHYVIWCRIAIAHPVLVDYDKNLWEEIEEKGLQGFTGVTPVHKDKPNAGEKDWFTIDVEHSGSEVYRWAGQEFESPGGHEVGRMVKGLWDERGWETVWFVNPPRLQSIPGYAHFHVFARRKRPIEIDTTERAFANKDS